MDEKLKLRGICLFPIPPRKYYQAIRARLVELEAENASLHKSLAKQCNCSNISHCDGSCAPYVGNADAIMRADALLRSCNAACKRVIEQDGGILGGIDFNALGASITAHLSENTYD